MEIVTFLHQLIWALAVAEAPPKKGLGLVGWRMEDFSSSPLFFWRTGGGSTIDLTKADLLKFCCCRGWSLLRFMCIYCKKEVFNQKRLTVLYSLLFKVFSYAHTVFPKSTSIKDHEGICSLSYNFDAVTQWYFCFRSCSYIDLESYQVTFMLGISVPLSLQKSPKKERYPEMCITWGTKL